MCTMPRSADVFHLFMTSIQARQIETGLIWARGLHMLAKEQHGRPVHNAQLHQGLKCKGDVGVGYLFGHSAHATPRAAVHSHK
jgi:hypothetical protein